MLCVVSVYAFARDLFAIAKFLLKYTADKQTDRQNHRHRDADERFTVVGVSNTHY